MKKIIFLFIFFSTLAFAENECVVCHKGIEDIRDRNSTMMVEILKIAQKAGHKGNDCIVCHGGNPFNKSKEYGHKGTVKYFKDNEGPKSFYPSPTHPSVNQHTCKICHKREQNKTYTEYMQRLSASEGDVFVKNSVDNNLTDNIKDFHNIQSHSKAKGCAVCHIPYADNGLYRGEDVRISKKDPNHLLVHRIQSSRKVMVEVDDINYTGIPDQRCFSCHKNNKYISNSYQGILALDNKHTIHMQKDIHFQKGMSCQDCHTSNDLHNTSFISKETLGRVEIECQDCHGTVKKYPWELPLGYSDEYNLTAPSKSGRGVAKDVASYLKEGYVAEKEDGYILSARGNPMPNVVKKEKKVLVHLANGKDIYLKPLKMLKREKKLSKEALVAMEAIDAHTDSLECYTCHTKWAPQHYSINQKTSFTRWEDPALAQNGEGRVAPVIPSMSEAGSAVALQPHSVSKESRTCENCHSSDKALGLGIDSLDKKDKFTKVLKIEDDFKLSAPLSKAQTDKLDRRGMCLACHKTIPKDNLAVSAIAHAAKMAELNIDKQVHENLLWGLLTFGSWAQIGIVVFVLLTFGYIIYILFIKKKPINPRNEGWK